VDQKPFRDRKKSEDGSRKDCPNREKNDGSGMGGGERTVSNWGAQFQERTMPRWVLLNREVRRRRGDREGKGGGGFNTLNGKKKGEGRNGGEQLGIEARSAVKWVRRRRNSQRTLGSTPKKSSKRVHGLKKRLGQFGVLRGSPERGLQKGEAIRLRRKKSSEVKGGIEGTTQKKVSVTKTGPAGRLTPFLAWRQATIHEKKGEEIIS